ILRADGHVSRYQPLNAGIDLNTVRGNECRIRGKDGRRDSNQWRCDASAGCKNGRSNRLIRDLFECVDSVLLNRPVQKRKRDAIVIQSEPAPHNPLARWIPRDSDTWAEVAVIRPERLRQALDVVAQAEIDCNAPDWREPVLQERSESRDSEGSARRSERLT